MTLTDYAVDDVITLIRRPVLPEGDKEYREIGIRSFGNGIFHKEPVAGHEIAAKKVFSVEPGDLVFSNVFAWEGAVALAADSEEGMIGSHRFMTYRVNEKIADARYLLPYFHGGPGLDVIRQASPGSAGRNRTLGIKGFGAKRVALPDLAEQRRVADRLDTAMSQIAQVSRKKSASTGLTLQHADTLFRSIEMRVPLSTVLTESSEFVAIEPGATYRTAGILNRGRGLFLRPVINGSETKYSRYNRLRRDQFVYSKLFGWEGSLAVVTEEFAGIHVSHEFPTFDMDPEVADVEYMTHLARWRGLHDSLKDQGTGMGSRRQRVNVSRLLATEVPLPDLPGQRRIAKKLTLARRVTDGSAAQVEQLATLRRALLDAAFSGRL
ncbi:restriction endonuclease subunit S [Streptomyces coelicoflavus]|uniref:restriction endonuclease subunit S n=1 Tax=Streptomyces coelicoflavus TaxID=285562 RepID=UPI00365E51E1